MERGLQFRVSSQNDPGSRGTVQPCYLRGCSAPFPFPQERIHQDGVLISSRSRETQGNTIPVAPLIKVLHCNHLLPYALLYSERKLRFFWGRKMVQVALMLILLALYMVCRQAGGWWWQSGTAVTPQG